MAQIAGVSTLKNDKGDITHVTIDVKKHKEIITPVLRHLGVIGKTKFQKECEGGLSVEEAKKSSLKFIDEIWGK
jgi:hypothetical protein